jgi:hypothetical protein
MITLIKKKIKFSSYIRKFRMEQLQSHICLTASSSVIQYMGKYFAFPHIWLCNRSTLNFLISSMRKIWFSFLSVYTPTPTKPTSSPVSHHYQLTHTQNQIVIKSFSLATMAFAYFQSTSRTEYRQTDRETLQKYIKVNKFVGQNTNKRGRRNCKYITSIYLYIFLNIQKNWVKLWDAYMGLNLLKVKWLSRYVIM